MEEFFDALLVADQSSDVGSIVVKGSGRAFSSGYDIQPNPQRTTSYDSGIRDDIGRMEKRHRRWRTLWELSKPSVAQVHGYCVAGGTDLAQHCDMIVASEGRPVRLPTRTFDGFTSNPHVDL